MATVRRVPLTAIRYGPWGLPEGMPAIRDGEADPLIVERIGKGRYDLVDGYHRLAGLIAGGATHATVVIPTAAEFASCREFGGEPDAMSEPDWIKWHCHR